MLKLLWSLVLLNLDELNQLVTAQLTLQNLCMFISHVFGWAFTFTEHYDECNVSALFGKRNLDLIHSFEVHLHLSKFILVINTWLFLDTALHLIQMFPFQ